MCSYPVPILLSSVTVGKVMALGSSLEPGPQKGCHVDVHLAPEFLHVVFVQLNSPASALALPTGPQCPRERKPRPSAALGDIWPVSLLAVPQHSEPSLASSWLSSSSPLHALDSFCMAPIRALDLNFARSGCEDETVAFEGLRASACAWPPGLPAQGHSGVLIVPTLSPSPPHTDHDIVCFTFLHIPQHSFVLSYLPVS